MALRIHAFILRIISRGVGEKWMFRNVKGEGIVVSREARQGVLLSTEEQLLVNKKGKSGFKWEV